ncbi:MAG: DUF2268 domain-containing putative Zn-dependent protease, partial [Mycobacterium leprae]
YQDVRAALQAAGPGAPVWPYFEAIAYRPHRAYFDGLLETYGPDAFGPLGLPGGVELAAPFLRQALADAPLFGLEQTAHAILQKVEPLLPGTEPDLYLGTLLFMAPAGTISVQRQPVVTLGLERFHLTPPATGPKFWYHPAEVVEMVPHEAAHVARMQALRLPPSPRQLSLLEMVMLEGTALTFTDHLLDRTTLATFMPPERLAWHKANDRWVRRAAAADFARTGMPAFRQYFSADSPVSGYYVGYALCREYLDRYGPDRVGELVGLPSADILRRLDLTA